MAIRKFLTSVADVFGYDNTDSLLFVGKTLLDSSVEVSLGSAPVRGGRGNQLLYIYYHTGEMKFTLTDTQWNLAMLGATIGEDVATGTNTYVEENVLITAGTGTITGTALAPTTGGTIYGWATSPEGITQKFTFSSQTVTVTGTEAAGPDYWCVRYFALDSAASYIQVNANMIPKVVKLVMETQLNSADVTTNKIGSVQIIAPTVTLSGAFTISMKADGVSNTPLTATALSYTDTGSDTPCALEPYYAKIIEIIDSANWWDNVMALSVVGGDFDLAEGATGTLNVWAIPYSGASFKATNADLDFAVATLWGATGTTVGANTGLVTASGTATGTALITASISATGSQDIDTSVTVSITL